MIAIIITILVALLIVYLNTRDNTLSDRAIKLAKEYLEHEKVIVNDKKYLYMSELIYGSSEAELFNDCNMASGVLVTKEDNELYYKALLKCTNYNSINNPENIIKLKGDSIVVLNFDEKYQEFGHEKSSYNIVNEERVINDNLKEIIYHAMNGKTIVETAERFILFNEDKTNNIDGSRDPAFPKLVLNGDKVETISYGDFYDDRGCLASDLLDGDLTSSVEKTGEIDSFTLGEYTINYKVTNSRGNYVSDSRIVKVIENSISSEGTCTATIKRNEIIVDVNVKDNVKIINYRYLINNQEKTSVDNSLIVNDVITKDNLPSVRVTINDGSVNNTSLICSNVPKLTPEMYIDVNGYNCLEGFVCYKQKDYKAKYQATEDGVGTIATSGCLPTSMTIISTKYDKRSINGNLFNPETLVNELIYTNGNIWGYSKYSRVQYIADKLNLKVSEQYSIGKNLDIFKKALQDGNPVIALVTDGCYANSGGHYLTVIGINDNDEIFISDPYSRGNLSMHKTCKVNTWSDINEFVKKGAVNYFAVISE